MTKHFLIFGGIKTANLSQQVLTREFLIYFVTCFIALFDFLSFFLIQARYCQERGLDANQPFVMYLFNGVASAVSRVLTGYVCDTTRIRPRWIFQISLFLAGLIAVLVTLFHSYYELLVCFIFFGMMDGAATSSVCILALFTVSPEERAQGFGFFQFCVGLSLASGPPFGGTVYLWVKKTALYLSVNVFSTKVLIGDTIFTSGTAILRGHPSHEKV